MDAESPRKNRKCGKCGRCCVTHPCALEPADLGKIASFLRMDYTNVFRRYLVLDYSVASGTKLHYVCPARLDDNPGRVVDCNWTFRSSPCTFLRDNYCTIESVKPRGGRTYSCHTVEVNRIAFGKKKAAKAWRGTALLRELLALAEA